MNEEFEFIEYISKLNGYPVAFIKSQIRKTLDRYIDKSNGIQTRKSKDNKLDQIDNSLKKRHIFFDIPFFGKPTEIFKKQIVKMTKTIDPLVNIQPIQRPPVTLSSFFPIKDQVPKLLKSKVVYKLDCSNCDATYIGKTVRHTSKRLQEHGADLKTMNITRPNTEVVIVNSVNLRRSDRNKNKTVQYYPEIVIDEILPEQNKFTLSAVKQHENNTNHTIDWTNFNIIARDNKNYQLLVKESLLINSQKPSLNKTTSSVPLIIFPEGLKIKPQVKIKSTLDVLPLVGV